MNRKIPNILTVLRIFLAPVFPVVYLYCSENSNIYALILFLIVGATDILDGYIARKYNFITVFGTAMDPLADKLMLIAVFIAFTMKQILPLWLVIFVITQELIMIFIGLYFYFKKEKYVIPSNVFGKTATMMIFLAIIGILVAPEVKLFVDIVYVAVGLKIIAFMSYVKHHKENKIKT